MGARRTEYQIVGRYMDGKEVTGYHLQSMETGKSGRYTREQVAYLVGRDQITNCVGQIYQDKVLLRGKGMSLEDLPVQQEDGTLKRTENIGEIRKGTTASDAMEQWLIVGTIKSGKNTVGYVVQNAGCGIKKVKRQQVLDLARNGKIGNARVQMYNDRELLRGVGVNLDELPSEHVDDTSVQSGKDTIKQNSATKESKEPIEVAMFKKVFDYVAPKMNLEKFGNFMTKYDDEGYHRFDFSLKGDDSIVMFANIKHNSVTACYQDIENDIESEVIYNFKYLEDDIKSAYMQVFNFYRRKLNAR